MQISAGGLQWEMCRRTFLSDVALHEGKRKRAMEIEP
jgi:hypothetical protein